MSSDVRPQKRRNSRPLGKEQTSITDQWTQDRGTTDASPAARTSPLNELTENVEMVSDSAVRLNVFLQRHGVASRRKADSMILGGLVRINRKVVTTLGTRVQPGDRVSVNGRVLKAETPTMTYLFNKPDLCLTTRKDSRRRSTIFDIPTLRRLPLNVQPVGRLDFRSEGLLILTNDGNLAYALSHPRFHVEKTYAVLVSELFNPDDLERLRNGVELPDGFAKPLSVRLGGTEVLGGSRGQWLQVVVLEGRNRLVRRMLAAIGFKVVRLVRIGIGKIQLPDQLPPGQFIPVDGLVKDLLEKYRARVDGSPEGHDDSQSQADGKRTLSAKGTGAAPARSDSKSSESGWGERSRRQAAHSSKKQGGRSAPDRRRIQGEKKPETYARKKEAESMEMAKQTRLRKKRNEQKASVSK